LPKYALLHLKKAGEFIAAGEHDFNGGFLNEAASHAYYAMHHSARALLLLIAESPKTHTGVINVLWQNMERFEGIGREDVQNLSRAFERRSKSDYGVGFEPPSEEVVEEMMEQAKLFLNKASEIIEKWEE